MGKTDFCTFASECKASLVNAKVIYVAFLRTSFPPIYFFSSNSFGAP